MNKHKLVVLEAIAFLGNTSEEVEENGIFLGEMNAKLLQKIEELTLYTISQEKKIQKVEKQNESLKFINLKLVELQKRLEKLENK